MGEETKLRQAISHGFKGVKEIEEKLKKKEEESKKEEKGGGG